MLFMYWGAQNWTLHSSCVSPELRSGEGSPHWSFRQPLASLAPREHCWLTVTAVHWDAEVFPAELFPASNPQPVLVHPVIIPGCRTSHLPLLNFRRQTSCLPLSPACRGPSQWQHSSSPSATPVSFSLLCHTPCSREQAARLSSEKSSS